MEPTEVGSEGDDCQADSAVSSTMQDQPDCVGHDTKCNCVGTGTATFWPRTRIFDF